MLRTMGGWVAALGLAAAVAGSPARGQAQPPAGSLEVEELRIENGMRIFLAPRGDVPVLTLEALIVAGTMDEAQDEAGLAYFTGHLLMRGTRAYRAQALAESLDVMGAQLRVEPDYDYTTVTLSLLARDVERGLEILREILDRAAFEPEEVERKRSEVLGYLERLKDDYVDVVRKEFYDLIYGRHPYHRPLQGTAESVRALTPEDLRRFYETYYVPNNVLLAVVGRFDPLETRESLREAFGDWRPGEVPARRPPAMPEPAWRIETIQRDATQATIRMGHLGLERDHPDYVAVRLLNFALGGSGFGSRLMTNLREDRGITYGVFSNFWPRKERGYFFVSTQVVLDSMNVAIREILRELEAIREDGIAAQELERAKRYFTGNLPLQLQTNDQLADLVLQQQFYGLEEEFWLKEIQAMQEVTLEEIRRVAREHIMPDRMALVVLANFDVAKLAYE